MYSTVVSNCYLCPLDQVIRPLSVSTADPQPKSFFVVGEEEEESKPKTDELSLPLKPRGLDECVVILNNPEVRCYTNQTSSVEVTKWLCYLSLLPSSARCWVSVHSPMRLQAFEAFVI